jgi:hypothetical protein
LGVKPSMATKFYGDEGMVGKRVLGGFGKSMLNTAGNNLKDQVTKPGKITGHLNNASKAGRAGDTGEEQSTEETKEDLDF